MKYITIEQAEARTVADALNAHAVRSDVANAWRVERDAALARATAAEAREAGLREALARIRAFARPIWSDARCGDEMKPINADCLDDICDMVDAALAATAKEVEQ